MTAAAVTLIAAPTPELCPHNHGAEAVYEDSYSDHASHTRETYAICDHGHRWPVTHYHFEEGSMSTETTTETTTTTEPDEPQPAEPEGDDDDDEDGA